MLLAVANFLSRLLLVYPNEVMLHFNPKSCASYSHAQSKQYAHQANSNSHARCGAICSCYLGLL